MHKPNLIPFSWYITIKTVYRSYVALCGGRFFCNDLKTQFNPLYLNINVVKIKRKKYLQRYKSDGQIEIGGEAFL